jgi:hypothetical protein
MSESADSDSDEVGSDAEEEDEELDPMVEVKEEKEDDDDSAHIIGETDPSAKQPQKPKQKCTHLDYVVCEINQVPMRV